MGYEREDSQRREETWARERGHSRREEEDTRRGRAEDRWTADDRRSRAEEKDLDSRDRKPVSSLSRMFFVQFKGKRDYFVLIASVSINGDVWLYSLLSHPRTIR